MSKTQSPKTFALVHGSWHDKWCWELVQEELQVAGHTSVAIDLPVTDASKDFNDYAKLIAQSLKGKDDIVGVFHSRAGNYGPRAVNILNRAGKTVVKKMIFLAASFEDCTLSALGRPQSDELVPARNSLSFSRAVMPRHDLGPEMTEFAPDKAHALMYHDVVDQELVYNALRHLRPQHRPAKGPRMRNWPDVGQEYIICCDDRAVRPEWSQYVARNWLEIEPVTISGGHSPFLSRPQYLAELLIKLSDK